jgi:hypothetical protein
MTLETMMMFHSRIFTDKKLECIIRKFNLINSKSILDFKKKC